MSSDLVKRLQRIQIEMANEEEDAVLAAIARIEALEGEFRRLEDSRAQWQDEAIKLAGEVEQLKELLGFKVNLTAEMVELHKEKKAAEARAERLRVALESIRHVTACGPDHVSDHDIIEIFKLSSKALEDEKQ